MIFNRDGVPIKQVLMQAALHITERKHHRKSSLYDTDAEGNRLYRILHTSLGDAYRVFRAVMRDTRSGPHNKTRENARHASHS